MLVFVVMLGLGLGSIAIKSWVDSRAALNNGPVGTLIPNDRTCGKDGCSWIGEFVSADGTVTRTGVRLIDNERVRRSDPMPARFDNVHLHDDPQRPLAYPDDYVYWWLLPVGIGVLVGCPAVAFVLYRVMKRHERLYPRR